MKLDARINHLTPPTNYLYSTPKLFKKALIYGEKRTLASYRNKQGVSLDKDKRLLAY